MNRDYLSIKSNLTVGELIDQLRNTRRGPKDFYNIFIVDDQNIPIGYVPSGRVLRSKRSKKLKEIIYKDIHIIKSDEKIEDIAYTFRQYGLVSAPVVNLDNKMIGIMTVDDVVEIDHEESEDDMRKLGGLFVNDFYKGAFTSATSRFIWLGLNLLTAILASLVIDIYSEQLQQMIAIAVLMPIVASMGGNAGTQAMTIYVRAIATKDINNSNYIKLVVKEFLIGSINGFALSLIMGLIAYYWFDSLVLAFAISFAILINLGFACLVGIIIPISINKMKIDPALASGIVLTTFTDVFGFLSFLSIATYILNL
jgi:magnesium transporter